MGAFRWECPRVSTPSLFLCTRLFCKHLPYHTFCVRRPLAKVGIRFHAAKYLSTFFSSSKKICHECWRLRIWHKYNIFESTSNWTCRQGGYPVHREDKLSVSSARARGRVPGNRESLCNSHPHTLYERSHKIGYNFVHKRLGAFIWELARRVGSRSETNCRDGCRSFANGATLFNDSRTNRVFQHRAQRPCLGNSPRGTNSIPWLQSR